MPSFFDKLLRRQKDRPSTVASDSPGSGEVSALIDRGNVLAIRPSERKTAVMLFTLFCILGLVLTFVGIFFRGPGYSFVIPYLPFFENSSEGLHFAL